MDKIILKYLIDVGLLISFIIVLITGIIKLPGFFSFTGIRFRFLPMNQMTILHDYFGIILGALVFLHLVLNWRWIVSVTKKVLRGSEK